MHSKGAEINEVCDCDQSLHISQQFSWNVIEMSDICFPV
jgi:hypothetical protein